MAAETPEETPEEGSERPLMVCECRWCDAVFEEPDGEEVEDRNVFGLLAKTLDGGMYITTMPATRVHNRLVRHVKDVHREQFTQMLEELEWKDIWDGQDGTEGRAEGC
jgi:hypothetical protein